ncbi:TetR/AcrR family transcriptional regulator [Alicyclobacillus ferrooxydans]|uniref:HTH tetR-type domain-containing protein n=1 Tax=Alicyclobacillus ferrooxydans TaxID=471514 RepID=A0A0N8PPZ4_9BACL|nr:TetR/AcrR family transcriptional regulator [Alicyclobacillus ferrooxydans]KPV45693.1 hypothetical protein AN477_01965 [Alicyclobacillus ferrooxydans]
MASEVRQRILDTASRLFYEEGIQNVGVDRIVSESSVAKMSLYKHFRSKDELIVEFLRCSHEQWKGWFVEAVENYNRSLNHRILACFHALNEWIHINDFRGCPFINSVVELANAEHPGAAVAYEHRTFIRSYFSEQVSLQALQVSDELTEQLLILMDGAIIGAMMGNKEAAKQAGRAAMRLLNPTNPDDRKEWNSIE